MFPDFGLASHPKLAVLAFLRDTSAALEEQRCLLEKANQKRKQESVMENFDPIVSSIGYVLDNKKASEFGTPRILKPEELVPRLLARKDKQH